MSISRKEARRLLSRGRDPNEHGTWEVRSGGYHDTRHSSNRLLGVVRGTLDQAIEWAIAKERWITFKCGDYGIGTVKPYNPPKIIALGPPPAVIHETDS